MDELNQRSGLDKAFGQAINSHGHGFHFAVLRLIRSQCPSWIVEAVELPVSIQEKETHVDFVLRSKHSGMVLVAECKRVDPAIGRWCFVRSGDPTHGHALIEVFQTPSSYTNQVFARPSDADISRLAYQIAVEVRDPEKKGNGVKTSGSAIDAAVTQAFRATAGLFNGLKTNPTLLPNGAPVVPVVITTATLWATASTLSEADVTTGNQELGPLQQESWLWFEASLSKSQHHDLPGRWERIDSLTAYNRRGHARLCAIVNASSLSGFLQDLTLFPPTVSDQG